MLDNGIGLFLENIVQQNHIGIEVLADGNAKFQKNVVHQQIGEGMLIHHNGKGKFKGNKIFGNGKAGILIQVRLLCCHACFLQLLLWQL